MKLMVHNACKAAQAAWQSQNAFESQLQPVRGPPNAMPRMLLQTIAAAQQMQARNVLLRI